MNFALGTKKDYLRVHLVCKRMKVYTPLRSLQGDFSDDQIHAIMTGPRIKMFSFGVKGRNDEITKVPN
jgi:hypothetical protein